MGGGVESCVELTSNIENERFVMGGFRDWVFGGFVGSTIESSRL